jgi:two-component system response regulator DctR
MLHIVDDEEVLRDSLGWLASSRKINATVHATAAGFLQALGDPPRFDAQGDCLLLDVRMPGISGVALFEILADRGLTRQMPVIFLTGHGDVPMAVDTLKRGAFDFFEKPFNDNALMDRVQEAMAAAREAGIQAAIKLRLETLSAREREVLALILDGKMNKVIADQLNISTRTVEVHRAHIFHRMHVKTAVELARLLN